MDLSSPIESIIPSSYGPVLEVLERSNRALSGRTVAALVAGRYGHRQVQETLTRLVATGLVSRQTMPALHLYSLNRDHVAAEAVVILASLRDRLIERIQMSVESWAVRPEAAWLFGSFARGDGDESSDIDILLLRPENVESDDPAWSEQLVNLNDEVAVWAGNVCNAIDYTYQEFTELIETGERLPSEIARDAIRLFGRDIPRAQVLRAAH